jgi:hypothetical protein
MMAYRCGGRGGHAITRADAELEEGEDVPQDDEASTY